MECVPGQSRDQVGCISSACIYCYNDWYRYYWLGRYYCLVHEQSHFLLKGKLQGHKVIEEKQCHSIIILYNTDIIEESCMGVLILKQSLYPPLQTTDYISAWSPTTAILPMLSRYTWALDYIVNSHNYVCDTVLQLSPFLLVRTHSGCIESRDPYCVWNTRNEMCELSDLTALADGVGAVPDQ